MYSDLFVSVSQVTDCLMLRQIATHACGATHKQAESTLPFLTVCLSLLMEAGASVLQTNSFLRNHDRSILQQQQLGT